MLTKSEKLKATMSMSLLLFIVELVSYLIKICKHKKKKGLLTPSFHYLFLDLFLYFQIYLELFL